MKRNSIISIVIFAAIMMIGVVVAIGAIGAIEKAEDKVLKTVQVQPGPYPQDKVWINNICPNLEHPENFKECS